MKNKIVRKLLMFSVVTTIGISALTGCGQAENVQQSAVASTSSVAQTSAPVQEQSTAEKEVSVTNTEETKVKSPKYVFLFIGDGMTYSQFQLTSSYLGANEDQNNDQILDGTVPLNFMQFDHMGSVTTYDSSSFCPDSASTATSIASGYKTYSGVINMDETKTKSYTTIAEQIRDNTKMKVGVISSVNLNHATPAAFYAHQASRGNYYDIGYELVNSNYDFFAGGGLLKPTDSDGSKADLYELASQNGYTVARTQVDAEKITGADGKVLIVTENLADSDSIDYEIDREEGVWALSDYVSKGIEVLDNDEGFFLMCESGKIDWACHANDAGSVVNDVIAMSNAVEVAMDFGKRHPDETLIIVTGDHETGGLTIGFAGTDYATYLDNIKNQKISYAKYDAVYVSKYKEENTAFEDAMKDVEELFGLVLPEHADTAKNDTLVLNDYEVEELKKAYDLTINGYALDEEGRKIQTQADYVNYGTYTPFSVTVTHLLNNKSGINFASYAHTGLPAAVFAQGVGADNFGGNYDNTDIHDKLCDLLALKNLAD